MIITTHPFIETMIYCYFIETIIFLIITSFSGWWFGTFFIFHFIYGMSSFPLTISYFSFFIITSFFLKNNIIFCYNNIIIFGEILWISTYEQQQKASPPGFVRPRRMWSTWRLADITCRRSMAPWPTTQAERQRGIAGDGDGGLKPWKLMGNHRIMPEKTHGS